MTTAADRIIEALHLWVFHNDSSLLSPEMLKALHLEFWIYPLFFNREPLAEEQKQLSRRAFAADLRLRGMLAQIKTLFARNKIRWCPIKGADLAWRVWPQQIVRAMCDLDLLIFPDDYTKAQHLLEKAGWSAKYHYTTCSHGAMLRCHGAALELHFNLPHFGSIDRKKLWEKFIPVENGMFRLPLELNLMMLFVHAQAHHWSRGVQLLLDCGFLLKHEGMPEWGKIRVLTSFCKMFSPELLFCAFPDFFPEEALPENRFSEREIGLFRELMLTPPPPITKEESVMTSGQRYSLSWWCERLRGMSPSSIRIQTGNPQGHYGKLLAGYWRVAFRKLRAFQRYRHGSGNSQAADRLYDEEQLKQLLNKELR